MKLYILAFSAFVAAAGSASANNDYIDCDFSKHRSYNDTNFSHYCGDRNRGGDAKGYSDHNHKGGNTNTSNNY